QLAVHVRAETLHTVPFTQSVDSKQATQRPRVESHTGFGAAHPVAQLGTALPAAPFVDAPPFADAPPFVEDPYARHAYPAAPALQHMFGVPLSCDESLPLHAAKATTLTDRANADAIPQRNETRDMGGLLYLDDRCRESADGIADSAGTEIAAALPGARTALPIE